MFKLLDQKIIVAIALIAILLVAGTIIYTQWSYKQFVSELETDTPAELPKTTQPVNENIDTKPKPVAESRPTNITEDKAEKPAFDASNLLPLLGLPDEVASLLDGEPDEANYEKAQEYLQEKYGQSPEAEAVMGRLQGMAGGRVDIEDLTALLEDWIQVLPDDQQESKQYLMSVLTLLRETKGQDAEIYVVTDSGLDQIIDPALLENAKVGEPIITNVEVFPAEE